MKSIREWMLEHGVGNDDIEKIDLMRLLGSSTLKVNRILENKLGPRLMQILESDDFSSEDPSELLRQVIIVAAKKISGVSGTTLSLSKVTPELSSNDDDPIAKEAQ